MNSSHVSRLIDQFFGKDGEGVLQIQSHSICDLAKQFGTPIFVYDQSVLKLALDRVKKCFGDNYSLYYSMKANPDPRVVNFFSANTSGIEIASIGEFRTARNCGCPAQKIIFAGPGKTTVELREAIRAGVGEIHAESLHEVEKINSIAQSEGQTVDVGIRINPLGESQGGAMRMGGLASPFGIDEEKVSSVLRTATQLSSVDICGVHLFAGTQILEAKTLLSQYERFVELAATIAAQIPNPLRTIDFGGGLGIPYFENEKALDLESIASQLQALAARVCKEPKLQHARLIIEPGRFLTAEAGIYVARVLNIKESRESTFAVTDGGMHHHLAATGNLGQVIKRNFPIACVNKLNNANEEQYEVVGPLCTPLDRLGRKVPLPKLEVGDLICVFCSGAYARSASPNDFLSHGPPIELLIDGNYISRNEPRQF